jgi:ESCRT-I complex subunit TSG101
MSYQKSAQLIDQVLHQTHGYSFKPRVKQDCLGLISNINSLVPQLGTLTQQNVTRNLLHLVGTIPMYYKGQKYNIPMKIYIPEMYPYHPPTCYVAPTSSMIIKPRHKYVDQNGLCYLPYLSKWNAKSSNLYELVNQLSAVFGSDPPVYERQTSTPKHYQQQPVYQQQQQPAQSSWLQQSFMQYQPVQYQTPMYQQPVYQQQPYMQQPVVDYKVQLIQKIQQKLVGLSKESSGNVDKLIDVQSKLGQRYEALMQALKKLKEDKEQFEKGIEVLKKKDEEITQWLEQNQGEVDVDKVITTSDEQSEQIFELIATDQTIEDMLYFLDKGLQKKVTSLDNYLEDIRELSTKQFMAKALLKKIAQQSK